MFSLQLVATQTAFLFCTFAYHKFRKHAMKPSTHIKATDHECNAWFSGQFLREKQLTFLFSKLTFLTSKLTFLTSEQTFLFSELTFLTSDYTFLFSKLTFLTSKLTFLFSKLKFLTSEITVLKAKHFSFFSGPAFLKVILNFHYGKSQLNKICRIYFF
jgi:hypothetical protein